MDRLLATALEAADAAARVHLRYFGEVGLQGAREKAHSDFVSRVDLEAQEAALGVIRLRHPDHAILAEEESDEEAVKRSNPGQASPRDRILGSGEYLWIVDPLDGTTNYLHRHPQFAASVGVGRLGPDERLILEAGAVEAPRTGERWWAHRGSGAFKNGLTVQVSDLETLGAALIGTGFPFKEPDLVPRYLEQFRRILPVSGGVRRAGSAALDLCFLAEGILDGFWEEDYLSPWDVAAGLIILEEAGGIASRIDGSAVDLGNGSILAANNPALHRALGALVRSD